MAERQGLTHILNRINLVEMKVKFLPLWFVLLVPSTLFAWGGDGHQIVCLIAEDHLSPAAKPAFTIYWAPT